MTGASLMTSGRVPKTVRTLEQPTRHQSPKAGGDGGVGRHGELRLPVHLLPSSSVGAVTLRDHRGIASRRDQSGGTRNQRWRNPEKREGRGRRRGAGGELACGRVAW